jgi:arsenical pump membrane protein
MTGVAEIGLTWTIAGLTAAAIIIRPFGWPEALWAALGAALAIVFGLISVPLALHAFGKGAGVYLFLIGMMLLSEVARREGVFDWVAEWALDHAEGSPKRLFGLIYAVGIAVTAVMSNDATAVVLTPAVFAVGRQARLEPLPYLFVCAFIANGASFVLPISNPANIVLYGDHTPPLMSWLRSFMLPSVFSIVVTFLMLRWVLRAQLPTRFAAARENLSLSAGGRTALAGIAVTAIALLCVSVFDLPLGLPTAVLGVVTALAVALRKRETPLLVLREVSWSIIPLVGGLFILVEAIARTGAIDDLAAYVSHAAAQSRSEAAAIAGVAVALVSNLFNNLPVGLLAAATIATAKPPQVVTDAMLIGVDLGPNFSVSGSLATILWLLAIRREGEDVGYWTFLKVGLVVTPPALACALVARLLV